MENRPRLPELPAYRPLSPAPSPPLTNARTGSALQLYYHGSISAELIPPAVVEAVLGFAGQVCLSIAGYEVVPGYLADVLARDSGLASPRIRFLGEYSRSELLAVASAADVGLCCMPTRSQDINMLAMTGASNKAFDYMGCGLAMLVNNAPDWCERFVAPGHALSCDPYDVASVRSALQQFLDSPELLSQMRLRNRQKIEQDWHFEAQALPLLRSIEAELDRKLPN